MAGTGRSSRKESWFEGSLLEACVNTCAGGGVLAGSRRGRRGEASKADADEDELATPSKLPRTDKEGPPRRQQVPQRNVDENENSSLWRARLESIESEYGNLLAAVDRYCRDSNDAAPLAEILRRHNRTLKPPTRNNSTSANHQHERDLKEVQEKLDAMTAERNDALVRLEHTEATLRNRQGEDASRTRKDTPKKDVKLLEERLSCAQRERDEAIRSRDDALRRRDEAARERQKLFAMLQRTTTKRTDPPGSSFPNGDQIQQRVRQCQADATDLFHNLADLLREGGPTLDATLLCKFHQDRSLAAYSTVLDSILYPLCCCAQRNFQTLLGQKEHQLRRFLGKEVGRQQDSAFTQQLLGNDHESRHSLLHLFWTSSMQEVLGAFLKSAGAAPKKRRDNDDRASVLSLVEASLRDSLSNETNPFLSWALQDSVQHELVQELDGKSVLDFCESLTLLRLLCHLSDPRCFVWPPVAAEVAAFSPEESKVEHVAGTRRLQRPGDSGGRVLYPGLYYQDPTGNTKTEPCCKSIVVSLVPAAKGDKEKSKKK